MRAISLWQPWASLVVRGDKQYETRGWRTDYRGPLLIHAAKKIDADIRWYCRDFADLLNDQQLLAENLPFGAIVGKVELVAVFRAEDIRSSLTEKELEFGNYADGRFAWKLANPELFAEPVPFKGSQGFFEVPFSNPLHGNAGVCD